MGDDIFFTTVNNPKKFRRDLLESSKEVITILKEHQEVTHLREKKRNKIEELKHQFNELNGLMEQLDQFLPEESMKKLHELLPKPEPEPEVEEPEEDPEEEEPEPEVEEPEDEESEEEQEPEPEPEDPEIARLENALHDIEAKLKEV